MACHVHYMSCDLDDGLCEAAATLQPIANPIRGCHGNFTLYAQFSVKQLRTAPGSCIGK